MHSTQPATNNHRPDDEISLAEIGQALWSRRLIIVGSTVVAALIAVTISLLMTPIFEAEVVLSPVSDDGSSGLSSVTAQLGGLASLAGVSIGGDTSGAEALATLSSRVLVEEYIRSQNLLPVLYADDWDAERKNWNEDVELPPTLWFATRKFLKDVVSVQADKKTGLVTLKVEWEDPELTAQWANDLVKLTNERLRGQAIAASAKNIAYLYEQLEKTSVVEIRESIYRLLESETKKVMLAQGSEEYAFKVVDPAMVPEKKAKPKRALIAAIGTFMGFMLAALYALVAPKRSTSPPST